MARVLVVDDCDDAAMTMAVLLKHCGHQAAVAESGEAALQQAPLFRPDALFIDLSMPTVDGFSVARQLRQTAEFAETPLVAVSGYADPEHRAEATAAGFTEFLAKPYSLDALQATMARISGRIKASHAQAEIMQSAAEQSYRRTEQSRQGLDDYWRTRRTEILVLVEKSGISNILSVAKRPDAEELRQWLKDQRCRVGPVFEPVAGRFAFFVYTRRLLTDELIAQHGAFRVMH